MCVLTEQIRVLRVTMPLTLREASMCARCRSVPCQTSSAVLEQILAVYHMRLAIVPLTSSEQVQHDLVLHDGSP